jgi:hypothetical protein
MIRVSINETFPIAATLIDEATNAPATGQTVYYDVRKQPGDQALVPPLSGTLTESTVEPGIYSTLASVAEVGSYIIYANCSSFLSNSEELIVEDGNLAELIKQNRHYNTSVEDVIRTTATPTASQAARNVPFGLTDYILTEVKADDSLDWAGGTIASGIVYAHYRIVTDTVPYKMGGPF